MVGCIETQLAFCRWKMTAKPWHLVAVWNTGGGRGMMIAATSMSTTWRRSAALSQNWQGCTLPPRANIVVVPAWVVEIAAHSKIALYGVARSSTIYYQNAQNVRNSCRGAFCSPDFIYRTPRCWAVERALVN